MAIKYKPDFSAAYYEKGIAQMELGNYPEAIDSFTKCKEFDKDQTDNCNEKINQCNDAVNNLVKNENQ